VSDFARAVPEDSAVPVAKATAPKREVEELVDADVPAAVVCAHCGDADCPGCLHEQTRSGVVAVVPWERPGASAWMRLWTTARATTFEADRFFESMPDGPLAPALRFAIVSEMIAATAMGLLLFVPLAVIAPGIPGLAVLLVAAHVAHGWALDRGARSSGARGATTRALRFGLYAAGWDLVIGPLGVVVVAAKEGVRAALSIGGVGMGLPGRSARAFLRGCYHLEGAPAQPALRASYTAAVVATAVGTVAVISAIVAVLLA
jgi:hypothetical protein